MPRWIQALLTLILGLIIGLIYGWKIAPVEYIDLAPNTLHAEYRTEYILMVAEAYQSENDLDLAARRLALLGSAAPAEIIAESLENGDYTQNESKIIKKLLGEIQTWQPTLTESKP